MWFPKIQVEKPGFERLLPRLYWCRSSIFQIIDTPTNFLSWRINCFNSWLVTYTVAIYSISCPRRHNDLFEWEITDATRLLRFSDLKFSVRPVILIQLKNKQAWQLSDSVVSLFCNIKPIYILAADLLIISRSMYQLLVFFFKLFLVKVEDVVFITATLFWYIKNDVADKRTYSLLFWVSGLRRLRNEVEVD